MSQVDALLIEKCEAWYERRGIPVRKLGSVKAAMTVAEKWEQLLGCRKLCGTAVWLGARAVDFHGFPLKQVHGRRI